MRLIDASFTACVVTPALMSASTTVTALLWLLTVLMTVAAHCQSLSESHAQRGTAEVMDYDGMLTTYSRQ